MRLSWLLALSMLFGLTFPVQAQPTVSAVIADAPIPAALARQWEGDVARPGGWPMFILLQLDRPSAAGGPRLLVLGQTIPFDRVEVTANRIVLRAGTAERGTVIDAELRDGRLVGTLGPSNTPMTFALDAVPAYPKPRDRLEAWQQDLDALATRFVRVERSFTPESRAAFRSAIERIRRDLPGLSDQQIKARMAAALALADNAHTRLYLVRVRTQVTQLPIGLWWFADGPRIVRTAADHERLLGCRIDRIGGRTIHQARAAVDPLYAGVPSWRDYMSSYTLASPDLLYGTGVTVAPDRVTYRLGDCAAKGDIMLPALPLAKSDSAVESWWDLLPAYGKDPARRQLLASRGVAPPLYLAEAARFYWHRRLPEHDVLYLNYSRAADDPAESASAYAKRLLAEWDARPPRAFVLDLRFNTGGNGLLSEPLMQALRERTQGMPRYVITGRASFSAGIAAAARWRELPDVRIVGEPVGDRLDWWSEGGNILLPNSGLAAHFANGAHRYSPAPCPTNEYCADASVRSLAPDLAAPMTWDAYRAGRDPAMEAIVKDLSGR